MGLEIHPELRAVAKIQAQPKRRVSRDPAPIVDDLGNPIRRNADGLRKLFRERPYSARNSSFSISPGVTGANSFCAIAMAHRA
jgi:hypothetical protein